ncbi:hypothetical protein TRFO_13028 [Tritrichomonas foetus]|uniref:Leucine Rich Repeat family protein n=1 Tax=Tritrichomonas foetus TaxID=1144522 RepID=A0A1J4KZD4_9EUKA|nr:hypothetical protein TRFO_13028 [Tritrichomonas foetus]|eukprot:OHT16617.1 hypothetical protein TRFO_13028 [Tritrichomonas foetus]
MDPVVADRVKDVINSLGYVNLFISKAKKAETLFKSNIIIAINDRCLISLNQKGTKPTNTFSWLTTTFIGREDNKLRFQFNKVKFAFEFVDENLFRAVSNALQHILLPKELKEIGFDQFRIPPIKYSPVGAINRMKERASLLRIPISQSSLTAIQSILIYSQPVVRLYDIPDISTFLPIFLDSLPFCTDIKSLSLSEMGNIDPYAVTIPYADSFNLLKRIEIVGAKNEDSFSDFFKAIAKDEGTSNLFTLSFVKSELDEPELDLLKDFINARGIKCVEFHDAINRNAMQHFYSNFLNNTLLNSNDVSSKLQFLNLDGTRNPDLSLLVPKIPNIVGLSLASCSVEVSDALMQLSKLTKLRILDLSHNFCRKIITVIPPSVTSLYVNSVNWCSQTLSYFLVNLPNHKMKLFISDILTTTGEYQALFDSLPNAKSAFLTDLTWDGNKLHSRFFDFLAINKQLTYLSLSKCFKENNEDSVNLLRQYLEQVHTVKKLIIRGQGSNVLGRSIEIVVRAVLQSPQIEYLDLTFSKSDDFGITQIRRLLSTQSNIKQLIVDGTKPSSSNVIFEFLRDASLLSNIKVSFPHNDLTKLLKKDIITLSEFEQIRSIFIKDNKPECVYRQFHSNDFPLYLNKREFTELSKPVEILTMPKISQKNSPEQNKKNFNTLNLPKSTKTANNPAYNRPTSSKRRLSNDFIENLSPIRNTKANEFDLPSPISKNSRNTRNNRNARNINDDSDEYSDDRQRKLLQQNRKIEAQRQKTKNGGRNRKNGYYPPQKAGTVKNTKLKAFDSFSSEPASYNTMSQSDDDIVIPNIKPKPVANSVAKQPLKRGQLKEAENRGSIRKIRKKGAPRAMSSAPNKKNVNGSTRSNKKIDQKNQNDYSDSEEDVFRRPLQRIGSTASQKVVKRKSKVTPVVPIQPPETTRGDRTTATKKRIKKSRKTPELIKPDVQPLIRSKKTGVVAGNNRNHHENELQITYQQPEWRMPFSLTLVIETEKTKSITEKYSTESIVRTIFKKSSKNQV